MEDGGVASGVVHQAHQPAPVTLPWPAPVPSLASSRSAHTRVSGEVASHWAMMAELMPDVPRVATAGAGLLEAKASASASPSATSTGAIVCSRSGHPSTNQGGHTVFVIEFYDGCKYFGYTRKSVVARVASLMSESGGWGSNAFVREHGGSVPYVVRCVASNMDQRQGRQLRDLLVARAPGEVYVAYGDPVQWVIGRNAHRRHLTGLQRASCVSAALKWAIQGKQKAMHTERGDGGQFSPIPALSAGIGATAPQTGSGQDEQGAFLHTGRAERRWPT